jgi:Chitobiase/beta-hexosaminidase C-terminal domain
MAAILNRGAGALRFPPRLGERNRIGTVTRWLQLQGFFDQRGSGVLLGSWLLITALLALTGCEKPNWTGPLPAFFALHGSVQGGQHPISGSSIQVYSAGTTGRASSALPLLSQPAHSDANGSFSLHIACPSSTSQLYVTAREGNPGSSPGVVNPAIALMAALGPCGELTSSPSVTVNEVTTVGSVWPLAPYMSSASLLGYSPGDTAFSAAVTLVQQLADTNHGTSPGQGVPEGYAVQTAKLDSLADLLDACVNSSGGTAGDGSPCGRLFSLGAARDATPPTDTLQAALLIAQAPDDNVTNIFNLVPAAGAFQPTISPSPADWSLPLVPIPGAPAIDPPSGNYPAGQQVTLTDNIPGAMIHYTTDGTAASPSSAAYTSPFTLASSETVRAIAVDEGIGSPESSASYTITAASSSGISLSLPSSSLNVGSTMSGSATLGTPAKAGGVKVTLVSSASNDVGVSPSVLTIAAGQSSGSFTLSGVAAGSSTLSATAAGYGAGQTQVTAVAAATTAAHLVFSTQPGNTIAGTTLSPAPAVSVVDNNGSLVTSAANPVTIALNGGSGIAVSGSLTASAVHGVAAFSNLSIATTGSGLTLAASSAGLAPSTSTAFNVTSPGTSITLSLPSSSIDVGSTITGSITLGKPAGSGGVAVTLASSSANHASVSPSTVVIAAGQSAGGFTLKGLAAGSSTISAAAAGYADASTPVTVVAAGSVTKVEVLGAIPASQAVSGLGFNVSQGNDWEYKMAAAAGATHARYQCSWVGNENQTPPPNNAAASPQFTLESDCQAGLASAANYGMHSTIVAAYGSPFHQILTVTVPNGAPAGAKTLNVQFATGTGGDTLASMAPFYDTILNSSKGVITNKHSYAGGLIIGIAQQDATHATLTLASGLSSSLPANTSTQYVVNEYLYPPPQSFSPTDPSVLAFARYAEFLASQISASGVTGEVEIWNEPPWGDDPWDDRYDFYDNQPVPVYPGPQTTYLPDWGFAAALQAQTSPVPGVTYNWGGTEKTGGNSMLNPQMLANTGVLYHQPNSIVTTESFHPYGNNPEDTLWNEPCLEASILALLAAPANFASCNLAGIGPNFAYAAQLSLLEKAINPSWGIGHNITETGFPGSLGDDMHKARFVMRQFLGYQAAGVTPIEFYRLYDTSTDDFSFVNPTANPDGTHSPLPAYTALAGLMTDLAKIKQAPVTSYSASNLPAIAGYSGTYPLDTVSLVGARAGDTANSVLFAIWQRSNTGGTWATLSSPVAAPVTITIPSGLAVAAVVNADTRATVAYTTSGQQVTLSVSDDPVEVLLEPAN